MRTEIPGGWQAVLGPNGWFGHGNGKARAENYLTGETRDFGEGYCCGWTMDAATRAALNLPADDPTIYMAVSEPMWINEAARIVGRRLVYRNIETSERIESVIPPEQLPGSTPTHTAVQDGHLVSSIYGQHWRDGQAVDTEPNATSIEYRDHEFDLYKLINDGAPWTLVVKNRTTMAIVTRVDYDLSNAIVKKLDADPWVFANRPGRCELHAPDGTVHHPPAGEVRGTVVRRLGETYVLTVTNEGWTPVVVVRKLSALGADAPAWVRRKFKTDGLEAEVTETGLRLYGYLNGPGDMTIEEIPWDEPMAPYVKPVDVGPALPTITVPTDLPPLLTGYLGGTTQGNLGGAGSGRPHLIEGFTQQGLPWWKPEEEDKLDVVFVDLQESKAPSVELANAYAVNDRTGVMLNFYADQNTVTADVLEPATRSLKAGRSTSLGLRCYLSKNGTVADVDARVQAELDRYATPEFQQQYADFKVILYAGAYTGSHPDGSPFLPPDGVLQTLEVVADIARRPQNRGRVIGIIFFGIKRPPIFVEIDNAALQICAAVPVPDYATLAPRRRPTGPPVVVRPDPPVDPPVDGPVDPDDGRTRPSPWGLIAAAARHLAAQRVMVFEDAVRDLVAELGQLAPTKADGSAFTAAEVQAEAAAARSPWQRVLERNS